MTDSDAWGIKVRQPDMQRAMWLTPGYLLTARRVHASINRGPDGRALCERVAAKIQANEPGTKAWAAKL